MKLDIYLYGLICLCNIFLINQFVNDDNYSKYILYTAIILQTMLSIIIIIDDDKYINQLKFNCYFLKKIITEKDKKIIYYMTINKKINQINKINVENNDKKCDEEVEIIAPLISDKKNN
jgi:hypothetical protein